MTFPTVAGFSHGLVSSTSRVIPLPSSIASGNLLLGIFSWPLVGGTMTLTGWTALTARQAIGTAPDAYAQVWYKVATGSEGSTVTPGLSGDTIAYQIFRVTDYSGVPVASSWVANVIGSEDPPNLISGFGSTDTLWLALLAWGNAAVIPSGYPSGYSDGQYDYTDGVVTSPGVASARTTTQTGAEDPPTFTMSGISWRGVVTVAIMGALDLVADFSATPTSGALPLSVAFHDLSYAGTGTINSWLWDFGDGSTSTSQNPTHSYTVLGAYTVTLTVGNTTSQTDSVSKVEFIHAGSTYVPPSPSNAVIEIYASAVSAARWGVAHWGEDLWADAEWIDVTPQSVDAIVRWGSHSPEAGILTEMEPASWVVDTYDPDRLLDPGNPDSPYVTDLRAGLPIRIRHRGTIVRQGICETIAYQHKDKQGGIRVTDNVSLMARTLAPADTDLADTLRQRARDVIAAAGLSVTVEPDPPSGDPALAPRLEGDKSVWRHVADAAEQVLHVPFLDNVGTLHFRPWAEPYDRNRGVDSTELVDLGTLVSTAGLYSVVRAQQTVGDGDALIERRMTPVPRYGPVVYTRSDATPDADAWADAVLADRSLQTVQWIPGSIYPLTADDVEYLATLQAMERFGVDFIEAVPSVNVTGIIVGGTFHVVSKKESEAVWSFELELAQTADSPLYTDEDPGEFLLNDPGDGYLYAD